MITGDIDALVGGGDMEVMTQFAQKYPLSFRPAFIGEKSACCQQRSSRFLARQWRASE
jgi:hypothetical protein